MIHAGDLADARQEHEYITAVVAQRKQHGLGDCLLKSLALARWRPANLDGMRATFAADDWAWAVFVAEKRGQRAGLSGCRHRQDLEVGSQCAPRIEGEREAYIGGQIALVYLVEDHQACAGQFGIVLKTPSEHTFGDDFDTGVAPDAAFVAGLIANGVADVFAQ